MGQCDSPIDRSLLLLKKASGRLSHDPSTKQNSSAASEGLSSAHGSRKDSQHASKDEPPQLYDSSIAEESQAAPVKLQSYRANPLALVPSDSLHEEEEVARLSTSKIPPSFFFSMPQQGDQAQATGHTLQLKQQLSDIVNNIGLMADADENNADLIYLK